MKKLNYLFLILSLIGLQNCGQIEEKENKLKKKTTEESESFSTNESTTTGSNKTSSRFESDELINIQLTPFVPEYPGLGESGKNLLKTRLNKSISKNAYGGEGNPRFIIGPSINLLFQEVTGTAPTKYACTYEVTLLTLDVVSQMTFNSYSFEIKGVGSSLEKAFISAFRNYSFDSKEFYQFLKDSKNKIDNYYITNCEKIISEADAEAATNNFDVAYQIVKSIPIEADVCFKNAIEKKQLYFQQSLNNDCKQLLSKMKAELGKANDQSASGFNDEAMGYYALIDPKSDCFPEAERIYQEFLKNLNPKAKRDWDLEMVKYKEKIAKIERDDAFRNDSTMANFSYLKHKDEMQAKAEIEGNKKLIQKYQYDQLPWLRKVFHLGEYDPFDGIDN
jgi:hypothetical protein